MIKTSLLVALMMMTMTMMMTILGVAMMMVTMTIMGVRLLPQKCLHWHYYYAAGSLLDAHWVNRTWCTFSTHHTFHTILNNPKMCLALALLLRSCVVSIGPSPLSEPDLQPVQCAMCTMCGQRAVHIAH